MGDVGSTTAAPVAGLFRRGVGTAWVGLWLVFLASPLEAVWARPAGPARTLAIVCVALFGVLYLVMFAASVGRRRALAASPEADGSGPAVNGQGWAWAGLAGMVVLAVPVVPLAGAASLTLVVYLGVTAVFSLPRPTGAAAVVLLTVGTEVATRLVPGWEGSRWSMSLSVLFAGAAVLGIRTASQRQVQLMQAKERMAQMAVREERSRISRDLHDVLGHTLTVITVKAELAGRLVEAGSDRAGAEVADIERLARDALADVRATIDAEHHATLPGELSSARAALAAAGIEADLPGATDEVPTERRELFAWAVREGVTNVVRHSRAHRCAVTLTPVSVSVEDDGGGGTAAGGSTRGHGLTGLRQRAAAAGARVRTGRSSLGGFLLEVRAGPEAGRAAADGRTPGVRA